VLPTVAAALVALVVAYRFARRRDSMPAAPSARAAQVEPVGVDRRSGRAAGETAIADHPRFLGVPAADPVRAAESGFPAAAGYWRFDEGPGSSSSRDVSGAHHDCLLRGLDPQRAWTDGAVRGAIEVGPGWLECRGVPVAAVADTQMSVALWVRAARVGTGHAALVTRQLAHGRADYFFLGLLGARLEVRSSLWGDVIVADRKVPLHRWVHVAFSRGADGEFLLYQDGVRVGQSKSGSARHATVRSPLTIGAGINGPTAGDHGEPFWGAVDDVAIFDRALSASQIAALAAGGDPAR
jgi:hypothetical protein